MGVGPMNGQQMGGRNPNGMMGGQMQGGQMGGPMQGQMQGQMQGGPMGSQMGGIYQMGGMGMQGMPPQGMQGMPPQSMQGTGGQMPLPPQPDTSNMDTSPLEEANKQRGDVNTKRKRRAAKNRRKELKDFIILYVING